MKVFKVSEVGEDLRKLGRLAVLRKEGEKIIVEGDGEKFEMKNDLKRALSALASMGYEFAALLNLEGEIGVPIKEVKRAEEILKLEDFETLESIVEKLKRRGEKCGAIGIFVGFVREINEGKRVLKLEYERFDEMYFEKLREIEERIEKFDGVYGVKIYHKIGEVLPREDIVYVAVMSDHRKNLWDALIEAVESFKKELPVWKKEVYEDGEIWAHDRDLKKRD
ncbi:molybdopterin biosynthesis MoaE protein [Ferroglobus placidus DSM 10642]|uniref:Molybdopterin biosynthesis MoaE protein n=1 Tax=Ferroglobus placidus (strain DSM 10642 / AEDII12DO) TaxID=589924 RepID=D3S1E2_FERPA|nr:molybdenum cofactor biosynthesis protein MoaE [Ferroglobus placidus]ADC66406.1 molybdopterin biosynthesis MoaE protein [Ferroglobus placidus DSM 10642]